MGRGVGGGNKLLLTVQSRLSNHKVSIYHTTRPSKCLASNGSPNHPVGTVYKRHSLNHDITGSPKCPPGKADQYTLDSRDTVHGWFLSVHKMESVLCAYMEGFTN